MARLAAFGLAALLAPATFAAHAAEPSADMAQGARLYRTCAPCHSLAPDRNMSGPSLAGVWGRKAGSPTSFERYSPALKESKVVWNERTLDQWLKSPAQFIPHNRMTFPGIPNAKQRADLIAYLKEASAKTAAVGQALPPQRRNSPTSRSLGQTIRFKRSAIAITAMR
jgi:cytochrome c